MNFDLSDEQKLLRDEARRFLGSRAGFERLRAHLAGDAPFDRELWSQLAGMGWPGAGIPERDGGLGLSPLHLCVLMEELGRSLAPVPFFSTAVLAVQVLRRSDLGAARSLLTAIAAGGQIVAAALCDSGLRWNGESLSGVVPALADAPGATRLLLRATGAGGETVCLLVNADAAGVQRSALDGLDRLRPHARIELRAAPAQVLMQGEVAGAMFERVLLEAAVVTAFEQLGGAEAALTLACDYTQTRYAFGRPVAGNQAVKHKLADLLVAVELARSNAWYGAWAMEQGGHELPRAAAAARLSAGEAYESCAEECLHLHGGIGYTWEANCHFYVRRARLLAVNLGNAGTWSERLLACEPARSAA